jgi:WD40 repeat protein
LFTPARAPLDELAVRVAGLAGVDAAEVRRGLDADPAGFALTAWQAALAQSGKPTGDAEGSTGQPPRLLLVIDQFEQLFTQCTDEEQRRAFIIALHAATTARHEPEHEPAALAVLGVRADFEARCADYPQLAGAVQDRYLVTAMTERQLRLAISEPAKKAGSSVDDDLAEELLREVRCRDPGGSSVGVLPLVSHALDQAWRSRTGDVLTLADYERTGGIEGAVADSAQRAYDRLTPAQQAAARHVFTRLTACSEGVDTVDRAATSELAEGKSAAGARDVEAVLEAFAAERLLILAAGTVEISHEILLTSWPLLRDAWLAETHADRIVRTRLDNVAGEWTRNSRDPVYLYTGSLLAGATETAARISADPARHPPLSQVERDFLDASRLARRRRVRRRESLIAVLTALVIGLAAVAVYAVNSGQNAERQRRVTASAQFINESESLGDYNPTITKLLSLAAWRSNHSSDARYAMLAAAASPGIAAFVGHTDRVHALAFSPDGKTLASASYDGTVRLWNMATYRLDAILNGHDGEVYSVAFSRKGRILASGGDDGKVRLWDVTTRGLDATLDGHAGEVNSVAFSPNGKILASGAKGTVQLWDVATHRLVGNLLTGHTGLVMSLAFSPDGTTLAVGGADGTAQLWDTATQQPVGYLPYNSQLVSTVAFSPDGTMLAVGSHDGMVRLWNVTTLLLTGSWPANSPVFDVAFSRNGKILASGSLNDKAQLWDVASHLPIGNPIPGYSLAFSPGSTILATGGYDHIVRLWDVLSRTGIATLNGHAGTAYSVAFSPDGKTLASGSADGSIQLWDVATRRPDGGPLTGHVGPVRSVAFSRDGKTLASGSVDGSIQLWDVATRRPDGGPLKGHVGAIYSVAFSRDGKTLASGSADGSIQLWDVATRRPDGGPLKGHVGAIYSVAFSGNGKILASGGTDDTIRLWDVATHRQIGSPLTGHADWVRSVAFSPDGKTLASGSADGTVRLWDVATRRQIGDPLSADTSQVYSVAFSPDGKTLASGSADGTVRLWSVAYLTGTAPRLCGSVRRSVTASEWAQYARSGPAYQSVCP